MKRRYLRAWIPVLVLYMALGLAACAGTKPPERIGNAIHTITVNLEGYVTQANQALAASDNPEKERWIGVGERLVSASKALDVWAKGEDIPK